MTFRKSTLAKAILLAISLGMIAALVACGSPSSSTPPPPTIAISATSGSGQAAQVGAAFANPLVATVSTGGTPNAGVTVTFTSPASADGTFAGGAVTATATTNSSGVATSPAFTAGTTAGTYTVTASVTGASTPASFSLTNTAAPVETIVATSGTPQSATVGTAFANLLVATVSTGGTPNAGVTVTFTSPASTDGTFAGGVVTATATTNSSGVATSPAFTAGTTAGTYTVTANFAGDTGTAASFSLTNTAASVETIAATSGGGQSAEVGAAFANPLVATVSTSGTPNAGVTVTFTSPASADGTFAGGAVTATATTNSSGVATSPAFTAGTTVGTYTVTANFAGNTGTAADFNLTNNAAVSAGLVIQPTAGTPQASSQVSSATFGGPLVATVTNGGVAVPGASVIFTAPTTGASVTFHSSGNNTETDTTDAAGIAVSSAFGATATTGTYKVSAAVTLAGVTATTNFTLTNWDGNQCITPLPGPTTGFENANFVNPTFLFPAISFFVSDCNGNPVGGQEMSFITQASAGAEGFFLADCCSNADDSEFSNANGIGSIIDLAANNVSGTFPLYYDGSQGPTITLTILTAPDDSPPLPAGNYVFSVQGEDKTGLNSSTTPGTPYWYAGVFTVNSGGMITGGEQDFADLSGPTGTGYKVSGEAITGGTIASDAQGNMTITLNFTDAYINGGDGKVTFDASVVSSYTSFQSKALLIENDGWATGSGELDLQSTTISAPSGSYAFVDSGWTPVITAADKAAPIAIGGVINVNGASVSGVFDVNDPGNDLQLYDQQFASSSVTVPDSFGKVTFALSPPTNPSLSQIVLDGYIVDNSHIRLIEEAKDPFGSYTAGLALGQGSNAGNFNDYSIYYYAFVVGLEGFDMNGVDQAAGILAFNPDESVSGYISANDLVIATPQSINSTTPGGALVAESTPACAGGMASTPCYSMDLPGVNADGGMGRVTVTNMSDGATFNYNLQLYLDGNGNALAISMDDTVVLAGSAVAQAYPYGFFGNNTGYWSILNFYGDFAMDLTQVVASSKCSIGECEEDALGLVNANPNAFPAESITSVSPTGLDQSSALAGGSNTLTISDTWAPPGGFFSYPGIFWQTGSNGTSLFSQYLIDDARSVVIENDTSQLTLGLFAMPH